jgi:hypothetical protein
VSDLFVIDLVDLGAVDLARVHGLVAIGLAR